MTHLTEGIIAPDFKGVDQNNKIISLKNYKGKKVALYFYPKDNTPGCTAQACNLRDNFLLLKKNGIEVIGISPDDTKSHKKFEAKYQLPFPLIADTSHEIINKYGVWGEKNLFGVKYMGLMRTTFLIDEKGIIQKIFLKPKVKLHAEEIIESLQNI